MNIITLYNDIISEMIHITTKDRKIADKNILKKGSKVEKEHTTNQKKAETIALQHMKEFPIIKKGVNKSKYYKELDKMEKKLGE